MTIMSENSYDLVVLGGGASGIVSARLYLDVHPTANLAVIERDGVVGGTWSKERSYPGFKAQASTRMCEFSDMPISVPADGIDYLDCPESKYVSEYLEIYVDKHIYNGKSLRDRFLLHSLITSVKKESDGLWHVHFTQSGEEKELTAAKLMVATGTSSLPNIPTFLGRDDFGGPIIHSIDFGRVWSSIQSATDDQNVTVIGAGKSAADFVYQLVKIGKTVTWLIRKSGKGPGQFITPTPPPGFRNAAEAVNTRLFSELFISGLKDKTWWDKFLWDTSVGAAIRTRFDNFVISKSQAEADFERKDAREGFKLLKNDIRPNIITTPAGMVHYPDFWETVAKNVDVVIADIDRLEHHKIVLTDGSSIDTDVIMLGTGWESKLPFFSDEDCIALGLPHKTSVESPLETEEWKRLEAEGEKKTMELYPILKPKGDVTKNLGDVDIHLAPFRLYHGVGPLNGDPTIAFVGYAIHTNMFESAEVTAMWAVAYLDGNVKLPSLEERKKDIAFTTAYMRLRVPTYGREGNFYLYDKFAHKDQLLTQDLGLHSWHPKSWWGNWMVPSLPSNLKGMKDEYLKEYVIKVHN